MKSDHRFDIIIAGAGSAGLSLLRHILKSPALKKQRILLLDKQLSPAKDKLWCFWESQDQEIESLIYHSWSGLRIKTYRGEFNDTLQDYRYQCIRSRYYLNYVLEKARSYESITLIETDIDDFSCLNGYGRVHSGEGTFEAPMVFQSISNPLAQQKPDESSISLKQHFLGWEIETDRMLFDPDKATLMDFDIPQDHGFSFFYTLPFSPHHAMIEYTLFSGELLDKHIYEEELRTYLRERYNLDSNDYILIGTEFGVIPMNGSGYTDRYCPHVFNIGTVGGLTKPSTGYTFSRIQDHSKMIVKALEKKRQIPSGFSPYRFKVYDMMMLYLLSEEPERARVIFEKLFFQNGFDKILRFLAEESSLAEEIAIFSKLPYMPFFRSIYHNRRWIWSGKD